MYDFSNYKPSPEEIKKNAEKQEKIKNERLEKQKQQQKEIEKKRLLEREEESKRLSELYTSISTTMMSAPEELEPEDLNLIYQSVMKITKGKKMDSNERKLAWSALNIPALKAFIEIRNSGMSLASQNKILEKLGVELSEISQKTNTVKAGSLFAGMAAAKHLGESFAEDFGGDEG